MLNSKLLHGSLKCNNEKRRKYYKYEYAEIDHDFNDIYCVTLLINFMLRTRKFPEIYVNSQMIEIQ